MDSSIIYIGNNIRHEKALGLYGDVLGFSLLTVPKDKLDFVNFLII